MAACMECSSEVDVLASRSKHDEMPLVPHQLSLNNFTASTLSCAIRRLNKRSMTRNNDNTRCKKRRMTADSSAAVVGVFTETAVWAGLAGDGVLLRSAALIG